MSSIEGITGLSDETALTSANSATFGGQDLDQAAFMNLLTTQMQNQDPLDPMANEEFIAQLATFSSLEQLMTLNGIAQAITLGISSLNNAAMADLVGMDVVAEGNEFRYSGEGEVELMYDAESSATSATVTVYDDNGSVVYSEDLSGLEEGEGTWTWDGTTTSGAQAEEGEYTFEVTAADDQGNSVEVTELIHGTVDEMDYSSGSPRPSIDGVTVDISALIRLTTGSESEADQDDVDDSETTSVDTDADKKTET
ncbi:MAG TPA: flagellar hook capping FlgD N-terminal domain-containing protein [Myxococcota bacterium]|nr:flagellar hook capping FlgD N-terminal domain-containing protein [Myxococcota bacterium]